MMDLSTQIAQTKDTVAEASKSLLKTFAAVPDDKLGWSPSETSRSALWIMGHCGSANEAFAQGMRGEPFQPMSMEEFGRMVWEAGHGTATREEAERSLTESTAAILAALESMTPERMAGAVASPFGPLPIPVWMSFAAPHMTGHAHQIQYLQTTWGDLQDHMM